MQQSQETHSPSSIQQKICLQGHQVSLSSILDTLGPKDVAASSRLPRPRLEVNLYGRASSRIKAHPRNETSNSRSDPLSSTSVLHRSTSSPASTSSFGSNHPNRYAAKYPCCGCSFSLLTTPGHISCPPEHWIDIPIGSGRTVWRIESFRCILRERLSLGSCS